MHDDGREDEVAEGQRQNRRPFRAEDPPWLGESDAHRQQQQHARRQHDLRGLGQRQPDQEDQWRSEQSHIAESTEQREGAHHGATPSAWAKKRAASCARNSVASGQGMAVMRPAPSGRGSDKRKSGPKGR